MSSMHLLVTDLENSLQLKKLGISQESNFSWFDDLAEPVFCGDPASPHYVCACFMLVEVLTMIGDIATHLPSQITVLDETIYYGKQLELLLELKILNSYLANTRKSNFYSSAKL